MYSTKFSHNTTKFWVSLMFSVEAVNSRKSIQFSFIAITVLSSTLWAALVSLDQAVALYFTAPGVTTLSSTSLKFLRWRHVPVSSSPPQTTHLTGYYWCLNTNILFWWTFSRSLQAFERKTKGRRLKIQLQQMERTRFLSPIWSILEFFTFIGHYWRDKEHNTSMCNLFVFTNRGNKASYRLSGCYSIYF